MTGLFCKLIGAWKFLNAGPRIQPKFTRLFLLLEVWSGHEAMRGMKYLSCDSYVTASRSYLLCLLCKIWVWSGAAANSRG